MNLSFWQFVLDGSDITLKTHLLQEEQSERSGRYIVMVTCTAQQYEQWQILPLNLEVLNF